MLVLGTCLGLYTSSVGQGIPDSVWIYSQELGESKAFTRQCVPDCLEGQIVVNGVCQDNVLLFKFVD